jgi:hypothetical protein
MTKAPCVTYAIPPTMQDAAAHSGKLPEPEVETQPVKIWLWDEVGAPNNQGNMNYGLAQGATWSDYFCDLLERAGDLADVELLVMRGPTVTPVGRMPGMVHNHTPEHLRDHGPARVFQRATGVEIAPYTGSVAHEEELPTALDQLSWLMESGDYTTLILDALILHAEDDESVFAPERFLVPHMEWARKNGYRVLVEPHPFHPHHGDRRKYLETYGIGTLDLDHRWKSYRDRMAAGLCSSPTDRARSVVVNCKGPAEKRLHKMTAGQKYMYLSGVAHEQASWGIDTICVPVHAWSDALRRSLRETHVTYRNTDQGDSADHGDAPGT